MGHPGGEAAPPDLMAGAPGGPAARPFPAELARLLHDLRGPLNSAVMHLEVLKRTVADDPAAADSLRTVLQQLARLSDMLPAALGVAALESGPPHSHDLKALVERARDAGGHVTVRLAAGPWPRGAGDAALLGRAVGEAPGHAGGGAPGGGAAPGGPRGAGGGGAGRGPGGSRRGWGGGGGGAGGARAGSGGGGGGWGGHLGAPM